MKALTLTLMTTLLALTLLSGVAVSGTHTASLFPSQTAIVSTEGDGAILAVRFDLSSLVSGQHRRVLRAVLEWTVPGVGPETECNITAHQVTATWTDAGITGAQETLNYDADAVVGRWSIEPTDYERHGAFLKVHVLDVVAEWLSGEAINHGLALELSEVDGESLTDLSGMRLELRYAVDE
jgi:hypothetical protein